MQYNDSKPCDIKSIYDSNRQKESDKNKRDISNMFNECKDDIEKVVNEYYKLLKKKI